MELAQSPPNESESAGALDFTVLVGELNSSSSKPPLQLVATTCGFLGAEPCPLLEDGVEGVTETPEL